jgi:hypothetical protein
MTGKTKTSAWMTLLVGGVLWAGLGTHLQARQDPLRIIFVQAKEKPAVYILLDTSGSMGWPAICGGPVNCSFCSDKNRAGCKAEVSMQPPGASSTLKARIAADFTVDTGGTPRQGTGNGYWVRASTSGAFSYWYFLPPSRMAMVKNVFGNCVVIYDVVPQLKNLRPRDFNDPAYGQSSYKCTNATLPSDACATVAGQSVCKCVDAVGNIAYRFPAGGGPTNGHYWDFTGSPGWRGGWTGPPSQDEPVGDPRFTARRDPLDLVAKNINTMYWGMGGFWSDSQARATRFVPIVPSDNNNNTTVKSIQNHMKTSNNSPRCGGNAPTDAVPGGGTPTSQGLNFVKGEINQFWRQDARGQACQRPYYTILITDGQSNVCNPDINRDGRPGDEWGNTCPGYTTNHPPTPQTVYFPPGRTDELFRNLPDKSSGCQTTDQPGRPVKTFVIGISPEVSRCELNLDAYYGRTDASADDAGVSLNDPLPPFDPSKNYAFFANNPEELDAALNKIIAGILAGDYSTAIPVTSIEARGTSFQNAVFIPSTKIPGWKGTLRRWEVAPCGDDVSPATHVDVSNLTFDQLCNVLKQQNPRIIVTSGTTTCVSPDPNDPRNTFHFHLKWDAACSLLDQANPSQNDYNRRIYTVDPGCAVGNAATGPTVACRTLKMFRKDSTTVAWVRSKFGGVVDWSQLDFNGNGQTADTDDQDVRMLIDFILGGDGQGNKRAWLMGDVIGSSTQVVATPLTYALKTVPPKDAFDQQFRNRPVIAYVAANDGLLHAFRADHDPSDPASPPIELFAFLPPQAFPSIVKMFQNFLKNPKIPTGQAEPPNFDQHIWTMAAPLNSADIWIRWRDSTLGTPGWRTVLYVPMGPTIPGLYALDVTDPSRLDPNNPEARPPFQVLWYWTAPAGSYGDKVWNAVPLGPSRETRISPKLQNQYLTLWIVGVVTTDSADTHVHSLTSLLAADTGETVKGGRVIASPVNCDPAGTDDQGRLNPFCVPYHVYGHEAFVSSEVDLSAADMPNTHTFVPDTAGRVFVENIFPENALLWRDNNPTPLNLPFTQPPTDPKKNPIYFTPSVVHARGKQALMLATVTGSIFETDSDINDNSNPAFCGTGNKPPCFCDAGGNGFCTKIMLDIFDVDPNTRDIQQTSPSTQHFELRIGNTSFQVDTDGDGDVDSTVTLSSLTRATTRPLVVMDAATGGGGPTSGKAYFLLMDPSQFIEELGLCAGRTYLVPVSFAFTTGGGGGGGGSFVRFASPPQVQQPIQQLGFGPVTSITAVAGKLVVVQAGYGARIAAPAVPGPPAPNPTPTLPLLRGVRRVQ